MKTGVGLNTFKSYRDPALEPEVGDQRRSHPARRGKDAYGDI